MAINVNQVSAARSDDHTIIIGAGVGGLAAGIALAAAGRSATVLETAPAPGGKIRRIPVGGGTVDGGPTVFTMKWAFDELLGRAGTALEDHLTLRPASTLARHAWTDGATLDLHDDPDATTAAIGEFAGPADAEGYRRFHRDSAEIFSLLKRSYIAAQRPGPVALAARIGPRGGLGALRPFATLDRALGNYFADPRLRQLFGRYATYCGASPYQAPATLMLIAHVEQEGVWLIDGGMGALADALAAVATSLGVTIRHGAEVSEIVAKTRVTGVRLAHGETLPASSVIFNGDASALASGLLGPLRTRIAPVARADRSLSAITWAMRASSEGVPLAHHNVFFSDDYAGEFHRIFAGRAVPDAPTTYLCAQDRGDDGRLQGAETGDEAGGERMLMLINAPADGDRRVFGEEEVSECLERTLAHLARCGLTLEPQTALPTTPTGFSRLFPGTGGALYGRASHGWTASFARPGARTKVPGLYLAGGSAHPGPGVSMATLSGVLAAESLMADSAKRGTGRASTRRSRPAAISGGMSTG